MSFDAPNGLRSGWRAHLLIIRGPLTNKKIEAYRQQGYYSPEFREARREYMKRKQRLRKGNFVEGEEGRLIYSPL